MLQAEPPGRKPGDVENGRVSRLSPLYPSMVESPEFRWAFIRKVYCILASQLLLTVAVASVVVFVRPIPHFFVSTKLGLAIYILIVIVPFILLVPLYCAHQIHPVNYLLLTLFTLALSFSIGLTCAFTSGKVILLSAILTSVVVVSLTLYTFWAAWRGHDFEFLGPFLFGALTVIVVFSFIQLVFPLGRLTRTIYGGVAAIVFCGYIIYDTDNLIKRYDYDQYICAAIDLYLDILNLFLSLLNFLNDDD